MKSRRGFAIQLLMNAMRQAHVDGCFFFQAEDGIRDWSVTGVQTCALPIWDFNGYGNGTFQAVRAFGSGGDFMAVGDVNGDGVPDVTAAFVGGHAGVLLGTGDEIGRASCRERV